MHNTLNDKIIKFSSLREHYRTRVGVKHQVKVKFNR